MALERILSRVHFSDLKSKKAPPLRDGAFLHYGRKMGRHGFEPWKRERNRFTVCPLWPLGYLPMKISWSLEYSHQKSTLNLNI